MACGRRGMCTRDPVTQDNQLYSIILTCVNIK
jgi:hypothetical protein